MDPPAPEIDPTTLYGQIMEAIERLRAERDRNAPTRKLDESLMRLVYQVRHMCHMSHACVIQACSLSRRVSAYLNFLLQQVAIADFHDPAVSSGLINFNVRFEVEQALMMVAEFLKTTEMHPNDASYVYQNIQDCQREGRLVSSDVFRPTNTKGALGDFWIHRLQVRRRRQAEGGASRVPFPSVSRFWDK